MKITTRAIDQQLMGQFSDYHPVLQRVYTARGVQSTDDLRYELNALHPYHTLKNIDKAVICLADAVKQQKRILIVGDFDTDGATSCAVAVSALKLFGVKEVVYLVPNRFEYGYGLTPEIVAVAAKWQPDLLITVDNGIASIEGVAAANKLGMQVVITDHHLPGSELPDAVAIVNPNQAGDAFPSKHLAGVGVIFYLMLALRRHLTDNNWFDEQGSKPPNMAQFLDLVALGTVADVVPMDRNNRILVEQGLRRIRAGQCCTGLLALLQIAKRERLTLVASDLGFAIAPRLNAAGRLDDMSLGIECLLCDDPGQVGSIAKQLDQLNQERRAIESGMQQQALGFLKRLELSDNMPSALCLYDESWHQGVVGILAGRIKERVHRPVIVFAKVSDDELKGSARSITGLHIRDVLDAIATGHPGVINKFGGHAMAAGLSLKIEQLPVFAELLAAEVAKHVTDEQLEGNIVTDGQLNVDDFNITLAESLRSAGPWGQHFPEPLFHGRFPIIEQRLVGRKHLKLVLAVPNTAMTVDAIAFNVDENKWPNHRCGTIKITYHLAINHYQGMRSLQLLIQHLLPC